MKRKSELLSDNRKSGMVSPLVDVIFNLMITMFVFLMIYMAVAKPGSEKLLEFLRNNMPDTKVYSNYFSNIAVRGGSGQFTFMIIKNGSSVPLQIEKENRRLVSNIFVEQFNDQGNTVYESSLYRPGTGVISIETHSGLLRAKILPGALESSRTAKSVEFEVVVVDNLRSRNVTPSLAESWGDVCLHFYQDQRNQPAKNFDKVERRQAAPNTMSCFLAIRDRFSFLVKPQEIPFDPAGQPLRIVDSDKTIKGLVGIPLTTTWSVAGGIEPYEFDLQGHLPTGLEFDEQTGSIMGSPSSPGNFDLDIRVKDAQTLRGAWKIAEDMSTEPGSPYQTRSLRFNIEPRVPLQARLLVPAYDRVGSTPPLMIFAQGGIGKKKFEALSLPPSLQIDSNTGEISGVLTQPGTYTIIFQVTDENPLPTENTYTVIHESWQVIPPRPEANIFNSGTRR